MHQLTKTSVVKDLEEISFALDKNLKFCNS